MTRIRSMVICACVLTALVPAPVAAQNPSPQQNDAWRQRGPCNDPWINMAFYALNSKPQGKGDQGQCDPVFYRAGSWSSYPELYFAVNQAINGIKTVGVFVVYTTGLGANAQDSSFETKKTGTEEIVGYMQFGPRGELIGKGGAGWEVAKAGQIVAAGGGNIVAAGGGNIVAAGGGNLGPPRGYRVLRPSSSTATPTLSLVTR